MAGTWTAQNKVRPGAYVNFTAEKSSQMAPGDRGIVAIPMQLPWGPMNEVITVENSDMTRGTVFQKIGLRVADPAILRLRIAMQNATRALVYRIGTGAVAATKQVSDGITATAKYPGTLGNSIRVAVVAVEGKEGSFNLITTVQGVELDKQEVALLDDFIPNEWITLTGTSGTAFVAVAGVTLEGGTDGTLAEATDMEAFRNAVSTLKWHCMAMPSNNGEVVSATVSYIRSLREDEGKKVQAVIYDQGSTYDYEGVIAIDQGYKAGATSISAVDAICWVAGATAGAELNESNTYKVIDDATDIIGSKSSSDIEKALLAGKMVFSTRQDGAIVIEKDINTLHTYSQDRTYSFSKNRVIRCLDDIATVVANTFEVSYIGKVDNNASGRTLFKGDVINYLNQLQDMGAIQDFDSTTDIEVVAGNDIDSVVCNLWVMPVDAMEKLYMTVVVS